jgi:ABC-2 type transport system ATP-binding protein
MLSEVEHLAHRVAIVREGRLAVVEEVTALKARALRRLELDFARPVPAGAFTGVPGVRELVVDGTVLRCAVEGSVDAMLKAAARFEVLNVVSHEPDLEEIFLAYYRKDASDAA